jgi:endonuclease III related protein
MPTLSEAFPAVRGALLERFEKPDGRLEEFEPFAAIVAAILVRNGAAANLDQAVAALDEAGLLTPDGLREAEPLQIADALHAGGQKLSAQQVAVLPRLARWLCVDHDGDAGSLLETPPTLDLLRDELSAIKGLGAASADAILLHALKRPSYPVDRATFRVLARHGWLDPSAGYDEARSLVVDHAADFAGRNDIEAMDVLKEFAHGMERLGRKYCRATAPVCDGCPLEPLLPEGGPREADA